MIKNERQYRITRAQAAKFEEALQILSDGKPNSGQETRLHPALQKAQQDALSSQLQDLRQEIGEYEALRSGSQPLVASGSFGELPRFLIQARIASGMTQRDLAESLGVKEQQIQRYEATDYASANLERMRAVIRALGVSVREEVTLYKPRG
ncbi:MAG TPA: helix-turn-helix domain-containing protein [Armatimonadota bacterium]|nr:helix-turn-helix domain-containing protein [Armatimonadota bacterium]